MQPRHYTLPLLLSDSNLTFPWHHGLEGIGDSTPNTCEKGPAVRAGAFPSGEPAGIEKYLRHISSVVKVNLAVFGFFALLSRMGILSESYVESGHVYCAVGMAFRVLSSIPQKGLLFDFPSNAITQERSRARDEGGRWSVFRGFDIFLGYLLLTVVGVILASHGSAQGRLPFPAYILVRLCLGLPLTNLHMACVPCCNLEAQHETCPGADSRLACVDRNRASCGTRHRPTGLRPLGDQPDPGIPLSKLLRCDWSSSER